MTECENSLAADVRSIERFLKAVTCDWASALGSLGAVVEISAIKSNTGRQQKSFQMVEGWQLNAANWAAEQNNAGANVYLIPQPKKQEAQDRVACDKDILCMFMSFIDQDDEDVVQLSEMEVAPAYIVTTGTIPYDRTHAYYPLSTPVDDPVTWRATQEALARLGKGDGQCVNPARLMRLPGTVSYPSDTKKARGYVDEMTTWVKGDGKTHSLEELAKTFGVGKEDLHTTKPNRNPMSDNETRTRSSARELTLDNGILELLQSRRNTIPIGDYKIWRNIGFGTIDKYKGTSLEDKARIAFFDFSRRWENGKTKQSDLDKLWNSEDEKKHKRIGAGTAIMELKKLPVMGPPISLTSGTADFSSVTDPVDDIEFTGLAKGLHDLLKKASDRQSGNIQIGGVLAALSAVFGPSTVIQNGVQGKCCTNLYILALAPTAYGKESIRTLTSSLLHQIERGNEVFDGSPSDVSFHATLVRTGGRSALMIDEAGILAKAMKSSSQSWQRMLMSQLMQIYGRGLSLLAARQYRDRRNNIEAVKHPRPTLMLTSTIRDFVEGTTQEDSASGFFNRLTTFIDTELPELKSRNDRPDRQAIIDLPEDVVRAVERAAGTPIGPSLPQRMPDIRVLFTDDALERLLDFKHIEVEEHIQSGGQSAETWGRAVENVQRVAGLLAVSDAVMGSDQCLSKVTGELRHVETAIAIMRRSLEQLLQIAIEAGRKSSYIEQMKDRVIRYLEINGGVAVKNELTRSALRGMDNDARKRLLEGMVQDGEIQEFEEEVSGKPGTKATMYRLPRNSSHET